MGKDPVCERHDTDSLCGGDYRCVWHDSNSTNQSSVPGQDTLISTGDGANPIKGPQQTAVLEHGCNERSKEYTVCPWLPGQDDLQNCSGQIWGMCTAAAKTHPTCNATARVCNSCSKTPSCAACSNVHFRAKDQSCSSTLTECKEKNALAVEADTSGVGLCTSPCGSRKICNECLNDELCQWDTNNKFCTAREAQSLLKTDTTNVTQCPVPCNSHTNFTQCETHSKQCDWCESTQTCYSSEGTTTEYAMGQCFKWPGKDITNAVCSRQKDCGACLNTPRCGWCSADGAHGKGVCELGTVADPGNATELFLGFERSGCAKMPNKSLSSLLNTTSTTTTTLTTTTLPFVRSENMTNITNATNKNKTIYNHSWNWWDCPDVDECEAGLDKCGLNSTCHNEDNRLWNTSDLGYHCTCHPDFRLEDDGITCTPRCDKYGCVHGICVKRDTCECDLGYHGRNCSLDCGCNKHSTCTNGTGFCDKCMNNTYGEFCDFCLPGFHGNGTANSGPYKGYCEPCADVCNGQSSSCKQHTRDPGPVCRNCTNNTHGEYCEQCDTGYFIDPVLQRNARDLCKAGTITGKTSDGKKPWPQCTANYIHQRMDVHSQCVLCQCNGHAAVCDGMTGEGCNCQNNTVTDTTANSECAKEQAINGTCYSLQCSSCPLKNSEDVKTTGDPSGNAFCYLITNIDMLVTKKIKPTEIHAYQADPRYTNLDMRVFVEGNVMNAIAFYVTASDKAGGRLFADAFGVNTSRLPPNKVIFSEPTGFSGRQSVTIAHEDFDFENTKFYINIVGRENVPGTEDLQEYRLFYTQPRLKLDLVVFFTVFFSVFYLLIVLAAYPVYLKALRMARQLEVDEAQQMRVMATRPMAGLMTLLTDRIVMGKQAEIVALLQSENKLPATPIAYQPMQYVFLYLELHTCFCTF